MNVTINYFTPRGKWYTQGTYTTRSTALHEVRPEVTQLLREVQCPGLAPGLLTHFVAHVDSTVDGFVPFIVLPQRIVDAWEV